MLIVIWQMLRDGAEWRSLGASRFDRADTANRQSSRAC